MLFFLPLVLAAAAASSPLPVASAHGTLSIALRSTADDAQCSVSSGWTSEVAERLKQKFARLVAGRRDPKAGTTDVDLTLFNYQGQDLVYYGTVRVGEPPQSVTVTFDTGSTDLFLPVTCNPSCNGGIFNRTQSKTFRQTITPLQFVYGTGAVNGSLAYDTVKLGPFAVQQQPFNAALQLSQSFMSKPSAGLMGLGMQGMTQLGQPSFINTLIQTGKLASNEFSFYHARNGATGSQLMLGGYDPRLATTPMTWLPVPSDLFWGLEVAAWTANGVDVPGTSLKVMIDSGTTQIILPKAIVKSIYSRFPHVRYDAPDSAITGYDYYEFPCNTTIPDVGIRFAGSPLNFPINPLDHIIGIGSSDDYCIGGVIGADFDFWGDSNVGLVGVEFLKNYLTVFSADHFKGRPAIGFAKAR